MNFKNTLGIAALFTLSSISTLSFADSIEDLLENKAPTQQVNSVVKSTNARVGQASYYSKYHHNRKTANGERFDMHALTAAHKSLPFNCKIKVTNMSSGKSVIVRINDRGPFHGNRVLDLSYAAAKSIGMLSQGVTTVSYEILK